MYWGWRARTDPAPPFSRRCGKEQKGPARGRPFPGNDGSAIRSARADAGRRRSRAAGRGEVSPRPRPKVLRVFVLRRRRCLRPDPNSGIVRTEDQVGVNLERQDSMSDSDRTAGSYACRRRNPIEGRRQPEPSRHLVLVGEQAAAGGFGKPVYDRRGPIVPNGTVISVRFPEGACCDIGDRPVPA